jgi:hypothetical protein
MKTSVIDESPGIGRAREQSREFRSVCGAPPPPLLAASLFACTSCLSPQAPAPAAANEDTVPPGENLVVEGVPPIPRSLADAVGRYAEIREATFAAWHPTKHTRTPSSSGSPTWTSRRKRSPSSPVTSRGTSRATVRKNGTPVWYLLANDEGHGFTKKSNDDYLRWATAAFVRTYLLE